MELMNKEKSLQARIKEMEQELADKEDVVRDFRACEFYSDFCLIFISLLLFLGGKKMAVLYHKDT